MALIIKDCDVLTFEGTRPRFLHGQDIVIAGNRIKTISPTGKTESNGDLLLDGRGKLAVPGMMNTHAHVPMVLFRNAGPDVNSNDWFNKVIFPLEANLTEEDVYWGALLGLAEMIEAGVTSVADHYFYMDSVARAVEQAGTRANLAWAVFGHEGYDKLEETLGFVERWQGKANGRITTWLGPHSPYLCDPEFLERCAREAQQRGIGCHIHVAETAGQVTLSHERYGKSPVKVLADAGLLAQPSILAHCLYTSDEDLDLIAASPAGVAQAPKTYLSLAMGLADLPRYLGKGIPVGLASDGAVSSSTLDLFEQMRLTALTQKHQARDAEVMDLETILDLAFQGGARVLRQPDLGNLKEGNLADIVLLNQDRAAAFPALNRAANLVYNLGAGDVDSVICDGELLLRHGRHMKLDKEEIYRQVSSRLPRLMQNNPDRKIAEYPS